MTEEPLFDPSLKKKSKKKTVDFAAELDAELNQDAQPEESSTPATAASDDKPVEAVPAAVESAGVGADDDMFGGMKKKSKSKKKFAMDLDLEDPPSAETPSTTETGNTEISAPVDDDFSDMKKKKKSKSKKAAFDLDAFEKDLKSSGTSNPLVSKGDGNGEEDDGEIVDGDYKPSGDLGDDVFAQNDEDDEAGAEQKEMKMDWLGSDRDYTYQELLGRIFSTLRSQNPALSSDRKKYTIVPPQVQRDGSKKTVFANVADICRRMHRQPEHVIQFLFAELGTMGSIDGTGRLVIRGRFQPKQIENVLRRYIVEYVTCKTCKSPSTLLTKENRIYFMTCESCGSQRSVSTIKTGFQAQVGKRSKVRAQA